VKKPQRSSVKGFARIGFTLTELIVVIVIIAIISAIAIPLATGTSSTKAQSAARLVMSDLEYAQNLAITSQTDITVTFSTSGNSYTVSNASGALNHPITKKTWTVDFDTARGLSGVSLSSAGFSGSPAVTFSALGAPSAEGTVALGAGTSGYQVAVAPITGRVTVTQTQ